MWPGRGNFSGHKQQEQGQRQFGARRQRADRDGGHVMGGGALLPPTRSPVEERDGQADAGGTDLNTRRELGYITF